MRTNFTYTKIALAAIFSLLASSVSAQQKASKVSLPKLSMADILKSSQASDWRVLNPDNTLYLEMEKGRVVIELAPEFAPKNVANIKALVKEGYFDGLAMIRSHDNYVAQWGDPGEKREFKNAAKKVEGEFTVKYKNDAPFTRLPDVDGYAPQVGHVNSFAAARDPKTQTTWLTHCYGAIGVARGNETDSGNGSSLYAVTGHAPRNLDRNITVVGRVMYGIELLSSLPRGTGALGFYEKPEERTLIKSVRIAADVPEAERIKLEVLRTDTANFKALVEAQRNRGGDWYKFAANHIELCNVPIPVRVVK
ncbi:peptidylprolyl isomerase [Undibacterium amnicola]|uniref:peptidylprolyl isomerase n=1 Tax=Undibacterium amnicola TaxID=1834038 RepID=A0ABR6XNZ9_9BURK|nr:peptidylprolyl isomerase [Undibacterium amnicola]MBC3831018.1 peptidylprolyl isomerase [Undibacterium amnicola]